MATWNKCTYMYSVQVSPFVSCYYGDSLHSVENIPRYTAEIWLCTHTWNLIVHLHTVGSTWNKIVTCTSWSLQCIGPLRRTYNQSQVQVQCSIYILYMYTHHVHVHVSLCTYNQNQVPDTFQCKWTQCSFHLAQGFGMFTYCYATTWPQVHVHLD